MPVEPLQPSSTVWWPDHQTVEDANLTRFMQALGVDGFGALNERASADPVGFHDAPIKALAAPRSRSGSTTWAPSPPLWTPQPSASCWRTRPLAVHADEGTQECRLNGRSFEPDCVLPKAEPG